MVVYLILLLVVSALFSASETAFVVSNKGKIQVKARKKNLGGMLALQFMQSPERFFTTVLVGNTVVNFIFSSLAIILFHTGFGINEPIAFGIVTVLVLLFGDMIPKSIARVVADASIGYASVFIQICYWVFYPLIFAVRAASKLVVRVFGVATPNISSFFNKKDFELLLRESENVGLVNREERKRIAKVISLSDVYAKDVMVQRAGMHLIEEKSSIEQVIQFFTQHGFSKMLVYSESIDNITGVIVARDLFNKPQRIAEILHPVTIVPETINCSDLFRTFRTKQVSFAVVVDEFGGTAGIVTVNDIIRYFLGDVSEDHFAQDTKIKKLSDGSYLLSGSISVATLNEEFATRCRVAIPSGPYDSLAGYVVYSIDRIPVEKEVIHLEDKIFTIMKATPTKIELLKCNFSSEEKIIL